MKKTILGFLFIMTAIGIFAQNGVIREVAGTVEIKRPGASDFIAASVGDSISRDTIISTGFRSTALVEVGSTVLTVRPLTRLSLTEISSTAGGETLNVSLQAGRVRVDVNPPAGTRAEMQISSPVATASVRGTSFEFDMRNIYVNSGRVTFQGSRGSNRSIHQGDISSIESDDTVADPIRVRTVRLRPQRPVGADAAGTGEIGDTQAFTAGSFDIGVFYGP